MEKEKKSIKGPREHEGSWASPKGTREVEDLWDIGNSWGRWKVTSNFYKYSLMSHSKGLLALKLG